MFRKRKQGSRGSKSSPRSSSAPSELKYPHPKILLLDISAETEKALKSDGYNVRAGTLGCPYKVPKSDSFHVVISEASAPNLTEQEIIVVDVAPPKTLDGPPKEVETADGVNAWWSTCAPGQIDPRPLVMASFREKFERIFTHGGVFVIFADYRTTGEYVWGHTSHRGVREVEKEHLGNWSFLPFLSKLQATQDNGEEISVEKDIFLLSPLLYEYLEGATFSCTLKALWPLDKRWVPLAKNKYGGTVAAVIIPTDKEGWVFIFPRIKQKSEFLLRFFKECLPELAGQLFPDIEGGRWVQRPEYELPRVLELNSKISAIEKEAKSNVAVIEKEIEEEREAEQYQHDLIAGTDSRLVQAVKKALDVLGFQNVVDVDANTDDANMLREDLHIRDNSPILLVEVKGIGGLPKDTASLQAWKYLAPRMKEWARTDIQALSIINHQRNIPALERENTQPFRKDILCNAEQHTFGLITTWDLFRLLRSYLKNGWVHQDIKDLFYKTGRIEPIPTHYECLGVVEHYWPQAKAVGVRIKQGELTKGDHIAFEFPVQFKEQEAASMEIDHVQVEHADLEDFVGVKTELTGLREGIRVFRIVDG